MKLENHRNIKTISIMRIYFLYFIMYSVIGWIYEVFLELVVYKAGFINRGVLFGPYCPVYGVGTMAFLICLNKIMKKNSPSWFKILKPFIIFLGCMIIATAIELFTSYMLEFFTGSWPWQTYVEYSINFEGRIALSPSIRFGLGGLLFLYILQPIFENLTAKMSEKSLKISSNIIFIIFIIDLLFYIIKLL